MKLLLDECVTRYLKREFAGHEVQTVDEAGLKGLKNGELLRAASETFDVLITVDRNISHQQNVRDLKIAILVLVAKKNSIDALVPLIPQALNILTQLARGEIVQIGS
jgi:predicted nuclease of predicted toxin-antitoxin system